LFTAIYTFPMQCSDCLNSDPGWCHVSISHRQATPPPAGILFFTRWMAILSGFGFPFDRVSQQDQAMIRKPDLLRQE
jgi:hypothetical protein